MSTGMMLLPPAPTACQTCARHHDPTQPHDAQSLYWATARAMAGEPSPTWEDALAHVSDEVHEAWSAELAKRGVTVTPRDVADHVELNEIGTPRRTA